MTDEEIFEFVKRCQSPEFQEYVNDIIEHKREIHNQSQRKFFSSEKGKSVKEHGYKVRNKRMAKANRNVSWEEKKLVKQFYKNCPKGYCVDHIIPISRGGRNVISNLQYLSFDENRRKYVDIWHYE